MSSQTRRLHICHSVVLCVQCLLIPMDDNKEGVTCLRNSRFLVAVQKFKILIDIMFFVSVFQNSSLFFPQVNTRPVLGAGDTAVSEIGRLSAHKEFAL